MLAPVTLAVALLVLGFNVWFWFRALSGYLSWRRASSAPEPTQWPRAHVFVCLKGELPRIAETVRALATQEYAGAYRVTFVTEAAAERGDAAAAGLARVLPAYTRCDHVVAGRVVESGARCAQKNFNLLAGIRHAEQAHAGAEVFAFCDGDLLVNPSWLAEMVRPVAAGGCHASTSFHWVGGEGQRIIEALHGLAEACQSMAALVCRGATWGGSMAIRASVFREEGLAAEWGRTVVDDMALSRALKSRRLRVAAVPRFLVRTESEIRSFAAFVRWLGRQYFFVKVYQPSLYHLLWIRTAIDVANLWIAAYHLAHRVAAGNWPAGPEVAAITLATAVGQMLTLHLYRYLLPQRPAVRAWASASFLAPGASLLACAGALLRRRRLVWRDLTYDLERDGCVALVTSVGPEPEPEDGLATEAA